MSLSTTDIFVGYGGLVGIGIESTYDTGVTPDVWLRLVSYTPTRDYTQVPRPHLHAGTGRVANDYYAEKDDVGATFVVELSFEALGRLLRLAMGPAATSSGAGPYVHTYLLGNVFASGTFRFYRGISAGGTLTAVYEDITGAKVNRLTIKATTGAVVTAEVEIIGKTWASGNQGTPTVNVPLPVLYHQMGAITWNAGSYDGNDLELTINNGFARRRVLGSLKTAEPHPSALREVFLRLTRDYCDTALITALGAVTESNLTVTFTGTGNNAFAIEMHSARVMGPHSTGIGEGGFGAIPETIEFRPRNVPGGTDYGLELAVTNDNASYLT